MGALLRNCEPFASGTWFYLQVDSVRIELNCRTPRLSLENQRIALCEEKPMYIWWSTQKCQNWSIKKDCSVRRQNTKVFFCIASMEKKQLISYMGFPCGSAGKESAWNAGNLGSIPGLGRSPREGKDYPLQYSGLENYMNLRYLFLLFSSVLTLKIDITFLLVFFVSSLTFLFHLSVLSHSVFFPAIFLVKFFVIF